MVTFGELLRTIGDFGVFQKLLIFALTLPNVFQPLLFSSFLFIQSDPERHCNTDWILQADSNLTTDEQLNLTVPREEDGTLSRCRMFVPVDWDIGAIREYGLNETTGCQNGWVYRNTLYDATIVTDFDLVCDKSNMVEVVQTVFMSGLLAGSFIFGQLSESYGRRRTTQLSVVILLIFVTVAGVSSNFYIHMVAQFIVGAAMSGYRVTSIVLGTEWTAVTKRSYGSCLGEVFVSLGQCAMAGLVYFVTDWRKVQYVLSGGHGFILLYIWWIPESARWLLGQGRTEEAKKVIVKVAAMNKREIPENMLQEVHGERKVQSEEAKAIFTSRVLMKYFFILSFTWFSSNLGNYCLCLNVGKLGLSIFLVQFLFGITEAPAQLLSILVQELIGRKQTLISTLLASGFVCFLTLAFHQGNAVVLTALATIGKFLLNCSVTVVLVYIQELFPTSVRQTAVGLGSIPLRVACLLSPLLNMLAIYHWSIPVVVFSSLVMVSGALIFFLPETSSKELPDSTAEAEGNMNMQSKGSDSNMADNGTRSTKL